MKVRYGYCCINRTLAADKGVRVTRNIKKKTFEEHGIKRSGELALQNIRDLVDIIKWNEEKGIRLYRLSGKTGQWQRRPRSLPPQASLTTLRA